MAGKASPMGRCVCELGAATHKYWYGSGIYFRQPLAKPVIGAIEFWTGSEWQLAVNSAPAQDRLDTAAFPSGTLTNTDSIAHTP